MSEWWQMKWISPILDPEDAQEEAIHAEGDPTPYEYCDLLFPWIDHTRDFQRQGDGREGQCTVWKRSVPMVEQQRSLVVHIHMAATICVSRPN